MADDEKPVDVNSSVKEINEAMRENIRTTPFVRDTANPNMSMRDTTPYWQQYYTALLNYKGAELNKKATDKLKWATVALVFATIGLIIATIMIGYKTVSPTEIKDGVKYDAKAFNWDKEKWIDVEVVFKDDEATISFNDDWHEPRTLFLVHPRKPKNPAKIEAIDGERDVHWDIKVLGD